MPMCLSKRTIKELFSFDLQRIFCFGFFQDLADDDNHTVMTPSVFDDDDDGEYVYFLSLFSCPFYSASSLAS